MIFEVQKPKHHPFRGGVFGLVLGFGLAEFSFNYGVFFAGKYTPWGLLIVGILLGVVVGMFGPTRGKKPAGPSVPTPTA